MPCWLLTGAPAGVVSPGSTPLIVQDDALSDTLVLLPEDGLLSCQCRNLGGAVLECAPGHPRPGPAYRGTLQQSPLPDSARTRCPRSRRRPQRPSACSTHVGGLSRAVASNALQAWLQWRDEVQLKLPISLDASWVQLWVDCRQKQCSSHAHTRDKAMPLAWV